MIKAIAFNCGQYEDKFVSWVVFGNLNGGFSSKQRALDSFSKYIYNVLLEERAEKEQRHKINNRCKNCGYVEKLPFEEDDVRLLLNCFHEMKIDSVEDYMDAEWSPFYNFFRLKRNEVYVVDDIESKVIKSIYEQYPELKEDK